MKSRLLVAAAATLLLAATGVANAFESHAQGNMVPGETGRVNRGNAMPGAPGTWSYNTYHHTYPRYRWRHTEEYYNAE